MGNLIKIPTSMTFHTDRLKTLKDYLDRRHFPDNVYIFP